GVLLGADDRGHASLCLHALGEHLLQIDDTGLRVQPLEHAVAAPGRRDAADPRVRVLDVAEHDRVAGAGLRAGRHDLAVRHAAAFQTGPVLGLTDPLHAERALLHDALLSHRDVRVELPAERLGPLPRVPVEVADLVRAVVGAVTRPDAAVVDLAVEPVRRVVRRVDGAHRLARRVAALLAQHRDEPGGLVAALCRLVRFLAVLLVPVEVPFDPHPVQDAALLHLLGADDSDVVLRVARGDARRAADAPFEVDRHRPARLRLRVLAVVGARRRVVLWARRDGDRPEAAHVLELADRRLHRVALGAVAAAGGLHALLPRRCGRHRGSREPRGLGAARLGERHGARD